MVNNETHPQQSESMMAQPPTPPEARSIKPQIPQWTTLIWGLILTGLSTLLLVTLLQGNTDFWSFWLILDESQRIIVPTVITGIVLIIFGLLAFVRRKN